MSIDILGFNEDDIRPVAQVAHEAGRLCMAQGISEAHAFTTGTRGGQYASELIFTTLREMGLIPDDFDTREFVDIAHRVTEESGDDRLY